MSRLNFQMEIYKNKSNKNHSCKSLRIDLLFRDSLTTFEEVYNPFGQ